MTRNLYYGWDGQPITRDEWIRNFDSGRVDLTHLGGTRVSTVYLGLDHAWGGGPPLIFETMIFGGPLEDYTRRYSTLEQAKAGHAQAVRRARWVRWFPFLAKRYL